MKGDIETIIEYIARSEGYDDGPALDALRRVRAKLEERRKGLLIDPLVGKLRAWHDERGFNCSAHSEGLECCVDLWLKDHGES